MGRRAARGAAAAPAADAHASDGGECDDPLTQSTQSLDETGRWLRWRVAPGVLATLCVIVYSLTCSHYAPPGDSSEMISSGYTLGVAHPPGYPLITLVGKLFTYIVPFGSIAFRINYLSVLADTAAALVLYVVMLRLTLSTSAALYTALLFAFSPSIWTYALVAEVFSLNNLLVCTFLYLSVAFYQTRKLRYAQLGCLVIGLGLSNQHTIMLYVLPMLPFILYFGRAVIFRVGAFLSMCAHGLLGLSLFVHLPLASLRRPQNVWGDHRSLGGVLTHFLREEYGTFVLARSDTAFQKQWLVRISLLLSCYAWETLGFGAVLTIVGVIAAFSIHRMRPMASMLLAAWSFYVWFFNTQANLNIMDPLRLGVQARFWPQAFLLMFMFSGIGWHVLVDHVAPWAAKRAGFDLSAKTLARASLVVAVCFALLQISVFYRMMDQSHNNVTEEYNRAILDSLPDDAIALLKSDHIEFPIRYLQSVENYRPEVTCINLDLMAYPWSTYVMGPHALDVVFPGTHYALSPNQYNTKEFLDANVPRHRMFVCGGPVDAIDADWKDHYLTWQFGLCTEFLPMNMSISPSYFTELAEATKRFARVPLEDNEEPLYYKCWEDLIRRQVVQVFRLNIDFLKQVVDKYPQVADGVKPLVAELEALVLPHHAKFTDDHSTTTLDHTRMFVSLFVFGMTVGAGVLIFVWDVFLRQLIASRYGATVESMAGSADDDDAAADAAESSAAAAPASSTRRRRPASVAHHADDDGDE